jgi:predicted transcriptional regulator
MKAVMLSIQPKWCELIASEKKTVEVRKTKPKIDVPFKCYIYCTKGKSSGDFITKSEKFGYLTGHEGSFYNRAKEYDANGKVIGEFVCDEIFPIRVFENGGIQDYMCHRMERSCVPYDDISNYIGKDKTGFGWHISELVIYDKPKELSEFYVEGDCDCMNCRNCAWFDRGNGYNVEDDCNLAYKGADEHKSYKPIKRPPQSWCYCEELK